MKNQLALYGGEPVRKEPYSMHTTMIDASEEKEVLEVLRGGHLSGFSARPGNRFLGGPKVLQLEKNFADYFGVDYAVSFNSATSALHGAVSAAGIGPGDEVIVPPTTMSATATCVVMQNAVPVFTDIEDETYSLDPEAVEQHLSPFTKAILVVNLFGHPGRLDELEDLSKKHGLVLIEDNSQSPGTRCNGRLSGTVGQIGVQSLNYHKFVQTGEGGMALTNDEKMAQHLQLVRNHGEVVIGQMDGITDSDLINMVGWNYRLTEVQAAIGIPQLNKMDELNAIRIKLAGLLTEKLKNFDFLITPKVRINSSHVYYLYPFRFLKEQIGISRHIFLKAMQAEGISLAEGYVRPIYLEPMFQKMIAYGNRGCPFHCPMYEGKVSYDHGICPTAERLHFEEILTTDICKYPNSEKEIDEFIQAVNKISSNVSILSEKSA